MKRAISIAMLAVFLFNVGGYYIVFWGLQQQAEQTLTSDLDASLYHENELIELTIPLNLPYPVDENSFQRLDGKFEHKGEHYRLVKQRFENNTLYIVCIKDQEQKQLSKDLHEYSKMVNDVPTSSKKAANILSKLIKDFQSTSSDNLLHLNGWVLNLVFSQSVASITSSSRNIPSPPPKV